jgi:hypothetical protein
MARKNTCSVPFGSAESRKKRQGQKDGKEVMPAYLALSFEALPRLAVALAL